MMIKPLLSFFVIAMFSFHPITKACAQGMLDSKAPHPLSLEEVQMIKETAPHPMLNLRIEPMLSSRSLRKGFDILIHQDNQPWIELQDQGSRKIDTSVPMGTPLHLGCPPQRRTQKGVSNRHPGHSRHAVPL